MLGCIYYLTAAINPILYGLISIRFRRGFVNMKNRFKWCILPKTHLQKANLQNNDTLHVAANNRIRNVRRVTFVDQNERDAIDSREQIITSPADMIECSDPISMIIVYRQGSEWI